ncbi:MAG: hypothetical protein KF723_02070 [Rhizobiaceae bacterium]|nr:hypothetical protein [Rhizobiaceae bacterium]
MIGTSDRTADSAVSVEVSTSADVAAGTALSIACSVRLPAGCDLGKLSISIRDHDHAELESVSLKPVGENVYAADEIRVSAPPTEGAHVWRAILLSVSDKDGASRIVSSTDFTIVVKAHASFLNLWDLPSAIAVGERFAFRAGIKCPVGCTQAGRELGIFDADGVPVGIGRLRESVWPGTEALYFADMEATAPLIAGDHRWEVRAAATGMGMPHAGCVHTFTVKAVNAADCTVRIEAFDAETQVPIAGARVVMHPYRAVTGQDGVATIRLVKGTYKLLVSASRYVGSAENVDVGHNATFRAQLTLEPAHDPASFYV